MQDSDAMNKNLRKKIAKIRENLQSPVNVNPVVDPSAALSDPFDTNYIPQNSSELQAAIQAEVESLKLQPADALEKIKKAFKENDTDMNDKKFEQVIRQQIRSIIKEVTLNQLPPSLRQDYLDAGAPATGQIPPEVLAKVKARPETTKLGSKQRAEMSAAQKWAQPVSGDMPAVTKVPATGAAAGQQKFEKDPSLAAKLNMMLPDLELSKASAKDLSKVAKKIADVLDPLHSATLKKIAGILKKIVDDYNSGVAKDAKFNLKDMKTDGDLAEQYANFLEFVGGDDSPVSEEDFDKLQPSLESLHTAMMDPYQLLWQGEKIAQMKVAGEALRGWMYNAAKEIKDEPALQSGEKGRSRINLSQEFFLKTFKEHMSSLGIDDQTILMMCDEIMEAFKDESPSNMTNVLSQKLIQIAFLNLWDRDFIDAFGIGDLFPEKNTGRRASMTQGFQDLATSSLQQQKGESAEKSTQYLKQLISNILEAMRSDSEDEAEFNTIRRGKLTPSQIRLAKRFASSMKQNEFVQLVQEDPASEEEIADPEDILSIIMSINV